jgi:hypothetical protein
MNIIFGKYQLTIPQTDDNGYVTNNSRLVAPRFRQVCGFGDTKIRRILAQVGGNMCSRVSIFSQKKRIIDREAIIANTTSDNCLQYIGVELKQLYYGQRLRKHRFLTSFKLARPKVKGRNKTRGSSERKKQKLLVDLNEI